MKESEFIVLSLPLAKESTGLIDDEFISWKKPTSILVNVSRGRIVDEHAFYNVLKKKQIFGAALDVWWDYRSLYIGRTWTPECCLPRNSTGKNSVRALLCRTNLSTLLSA